MRALILLSRLIATPAFADDWVDFFDGKTLQGWRQHNGTATCRAVDGEIVGETSEGSPNPFLCTTRDYGSFEMEFDVKVHDRLNTGIIVHSPRPRAREDRRRRSQRSPWPRLRPPSRNRSQRRGGRRSRPFYSEAAGRGWLTLKSASFPTSV